MVEEGTQVETEQPVSALKTEWEERDFLKELGNVCAGLEGLEEGHIFSANIRQAIDTIANLESVEDFSMYSNEDLDQLVHTLRQEVPQIERDIMQFVNQISRTRSVAFEVDFI
jgi:hypothetical protein